MATGRNFSSTVNACKKLVKEKFDLAIVGGGIVGTATAREVLKRHTRLKVILLEKENRLAVHQSGHNSGVIHGGIYYPPGSLKAKLCVESLRIIYDFCDENDVCYKRCGKLIVATNEAEEERLMNIYERSVANNVPGVELICSDRVQEIQPGCCATRAIWSPNTGIIDYVALTHVFARDFQNAGGRIMLNFKVVGFKEGPDPDHPIVIESDKGQCVETNFAVTCGGLYSDHLAGLTKCPKYPKILPFRGEYLLLSPEKADTIKTNIYPVPDPNFPFLGVHFTPRVNGDIWIGPNAVLAFKREGYRWTDINLKEFFETITFPGFHKLAMKNVSAGIMETAKSLIPSLSARDLKKFFPDISGKDFRPGPAGVRAQAVNLDGSFVDDFIFDYGREGIGQKVLHCRNAPSPAATSSFGISRILADEIDQNFLCGKKDERFDQPRFI